VGMAPLPDVFSHPEYYAALVAIITVVVLYQRTLSWREYKRLHGLKLRVFPILQRLEPAGFDHFVHGKKGPVEDAEYLTTVDASVEDVFKHLVTEGGSPHLLNSIKRLPDGRLSRAHVVWTHTDGQQSECYLFQSPDGVLMYAHSESSVVDARGHLSDGQTDADPKGVVTDALESL